MTLKTFFKPKYKILIHIVVFTLSIFSLVVTIIGALKRADRSLFYGSVFDTLLFVLTIYILAFMIIPLLFKNWKKYLPIAITYFIIYSVLLAWIRAIHLSNSEMLRKSITTDPLEYFNLDLILRLSMTIIPMGTIALLYFLFVADLEKLKTSFFKKNIETTFNISVVTLIMLYVFIMPRGFSKDAVILVTINLIFFYINTFFITPILFKDKRKQKFFIVSLLWFLGICTICLLIYYFPLDPLPKEIATTKSLTLSFITRLLIVVFLPIYLISFTYGYIRFKIQNQDKKLGAKESELQLLKSQVNPHFLFNTLNTLYATALEEKAPKTAESTAKLANLIRYMQEDIDKDFIPLENEIKYLQDYIAIQKLRCAVEPQVETDFKNIENHFITPGLLIPFVENAFKYGIDPSKPSKLVVSVICDESSIYFECINSFNDNYKTYYKEQGFGIGIKNAKLRLELVYPKKHSFEVVKENNTFSVKINITTKQ